LPEKVNQDYVYRMIMKIYLKDQRVFVFIAFAIAILSVFFLLYFVKKKSRLIDKD